MMQDIIIKYSLLNVEKLGGKFSKINTQLNLLVSLYYSWSLFTLICEVLFMVF